ncbi:MAG: immunoglobulin domain-containing protein, partial [Verrucomicrobia bacterium]|nr:immunoglobulin domain-containing protein [Verrucomicrobiota bacterium]
YLGGSYLNRQGFLARFRPDGKFLSVTNLGRSANGLATDRLNSAQLVGRFEGTTTFGSAGSLTSSGGSDVFAAKLGLRPPGLTITPSQQLVVAGSNTTLQVTGATGTGPIGYQWQLNGTNLAGATQSVLTLTGFGPADAGRYSVLVYNPAGSISVPVAAVGFIPVLRVSPIEGGVVLDWAGTFTLQSAPIATGPYADWPLATDPFTNWFAGDDSQRFFRLRVSDPTVTVELLSNGSVAVSILGSPGRFYTIESSTNLQDWESVQTDALPFSLLDTNAPTLPQRYYRAVLAR